jgi:hypothetical protein
MVKLKRFVKPYVFDPEHIKVINPLKKYHEENVRIIKEELAYPDYRYHSQKRMYPDLQQKKSRKKRQRKVKKIQLNHKNPVNEKKILFFQGVGGQAFYPLLR